MQVLSYSQLNKVLRENDFFIIDRNVFKLHSEQFDFIKSKKVIFVDNPEESKSVSRFESISLELLKMGFQRNQTLIVIGGGATTDLGGFVASTLMRGVSWVAVPSTLLGMIDAAIGGKVGVNTAFGKNLIGSFHLPKDILICNDFLKTLPVEEYQSGLGELVKYYFLSEEVKKNIELKKPMIDIVLSCAKFKQEIVDLDFKECGKRENLNFGHTFGHGIEKSNKLSHGLAVLKGIETNIKLFSPSLIIEFKKVCELLEIKVPENLKMSKTEFFSYLGFDKKNTVQNKIAFITLMNLFELKKIDLNLVELIHLMEINEIDQDYFSKD